MRGGGEEGERETSGAKRRLEQVRLFPPAAATTAW